MPSNDLDIKVRLSGARAAQRDADQTGRAVRGIGSAEKQVAERGRLAELSLKGVERSSHRLRGTTKLLIGATGIGGLAFGLKEVVHATIAAQTAQAKLQQGMKNAGLSWQVYGTHVDEALVKQAQFSGFQKGDVTDSLTNFIRTTGDVNKALKLNAIAANVAHTKNISLTQSQNLIARAYNGSFIGLKKLGIAFTPVTTNLDLLHATTKKATVEQTRHAKAMDKQATSTKAVALIQQKFQGQTAAWGKTAEGSVARARVSLEIAQEQIGAILLPYVAKAAQKIAHLAQAFTKNWPEIKDKIKSAVSGIKSALSPLLSFMDAHKKGILEFAGAFAVLAGGLKVISKFGGKSALGGLGKITGSKTLSRFTERGASPANPLWVAMVGGKGTGTGGALKSLAKRFGPAAVGAAAPGLGTVAAGVGAAGLIGAGIAAYQGPRFLSGSRGQDSRGVAQAKADTQVMEDPHATRSLLRHGADHVEIHTHVNVDGRQVGKALTLVALHQLGLR